jgi:hypothetical protein
MAVTLLNTARELSFTGNPLAFTLKGDNYITTPGIKAKLVLQHVGAISAGDSFDIAFLDHDLNFTVISGTPNDSGTQIEAGSTTAEIILQLLDNYYIDKYYDVTLSGSDVIEIEAKDGGSDYDITSDFSGVAGISETSNTPGNDAVYPDNYKILLQLLLETTYGSGTYDKVAQMFLDVDNSGKIETRLEDILLRCFPYTDLPELSDFGFNLCQHTVKRYKLKTGEAYGNPQDVYKMDVSDVYYVLNGKLPVNIFPGAGFHQFVIVNKNFLYTGPDERDTWEDAREYLYCFQPLVVTTQRLELQATISLYRWNHTGGNY